MNLLALLATNTKNLPPLNPEFLIIANTVFILIIAGIVIFLQFRVRPVSARRYFWVVLLIVRGLLPPGPLNFTTVGVVSFVVGIAFSVFFGILRGRTMPMWREPDGTLVRKGNKTTLLLWVSSISVRIVIAAIVAFAFHQPLDGNEIWFGAGVTLAIQQWIMIRRGPSIQDGTSGAARADETSRQWSNHEQGGTAGRADRH